MENLNYKDQYGRQFSSLRVSLTQACNFSCIYCVPEGSKLTRLKDELNVKDFFTLTQAIVRTANIEKIRITGGEPLLYKNFDAILHLFSSLAIKELSITTNAVYLNRHLPAILRSACRRINVSLDSLDPVKFKQICRTGNLERVIANIEEALESGLKLKLNMVPMAKNQDEIISILDFCLERGIECRYIELMKMGHVGEMFDDNFISMNTILNMIRKKYEIKPASAPQDSTAVRYHIPGKGDFGIIPNESQSFCHSCSRLRLTSNAHIFGCISSIKSFSIRHVLTLPPDEADQAIADVLMQAMRTKQTTFTGSLTFMKSIGG